MQKIRRRKRGDEKQTMGKVIKEVLYREGDTGGGKEEEQVSSQQEEVQRRQRGGEKEVSAQDRKSVV